MAVEKYVLNSREEWFEARKNHIGGSDAAACVGLSPYKDNVQLWEEKMGLVLPTDISDLEYVQYGIRAEPHLRELFAADHPEYQVSYEENNLFFNPALPWMHASLDGELLECSSGRHGILEIKTTNLLSGQQWEKWDNRIPDPYYCQVLHYLAVTEYEFAVLKAQIKRKRGQELWIDTREYTINREDVLGDIRYLVDAEKKLWDAVVTGNRPHLILPVL